MKPFILTLTLDAKIWHGHWKIVGNKKDNISEIPQLFFKIETTDGTMVESSDHSGLTTVTGNNLNAFRYRKFVAQVRVENAVKAYYDFQPWLDIYDHLKSDYAFEVSALMES